jgi:hypothetical protein
MDYGEVLGRAWRIVWKYKVLWIFGIFAGCSRGGGGGGGGGNSGTRFNVPGSAPSPQSEQFQQFFIQANNWIASHLWVVALFVIVLLAIIIVSILLGTIGRIGLIKGTIQGDADVERLGFGELWTESLPFFWRIFLLSLLVGLAFLVILLPAILIGVLSGGVGFLCFIPLICILVPLAIVAGLVVQQAELAIVVENLGIMAGLQRGWDVLRQHLGPVLLIWLILAVIAVAVGVAIALPVLIVVLPATIAFAISASAAGGSSNLSFTPLIVAGLCFVAYLPVLWVLNGILSAYLQSAWTLTYLRLTRPKTAVENTESPIVPVPNA